MVCSSKDLEENWFWIQEIVDRNKKYEEIKVEFSKTLNMIHSSGDTQPSTNFYNVLVDQNCSLKYTWHDSYLIRWTQSANWNTLRMDTGGSSETSLHFPWTKT
jgi:hypothetical protein